MCTMHSSNMCSNHYIVLKFYNRTVFLHLIEKKKENAIMQYWLSKQLPIIFNFYTNQHSPYILLLHKLIICFLMLQRVCGKHWEVLLQSYLLVTRPGSLVSCLKQRNITWTPFKYDTNHYIKGEPQNKDYTIIAQQCTGIIVMS